MATAKLLTLPNQSSPNRDAWANGLIEAAAVARHPVIIVAHGLAVHAVVQAAPKLATVRGAFFIAPIGETAILTNEMIDRKFAPAPRTPLPFPSVVIASSNDPYCPILEAEEWAFAWGSAFSNAGDCGHIDVASGYGPWPEGIMRFAGFMSKL